MGRSLPYSSTAASLASIRQWPSESARHWAESVMRDLCANGNVLAVVALGSAVRPVHSAHDFDCLYIYDGTPPTIPRPPHNVDIRSFEVSKVNQLIESGQDLLVWSVKFGCVVCERQSFWSELAGSWLPRLPFPSYAVADARARRAERLLSDLQTVGDHDASVEQRLTALTHRARAALLRANVFPASRPELSDQLRQIGEEDLAATLNEAIEARDALAHLVAMPTQRRAADRA